MVLVSSRVLFDYTWRLLTPVQRGLVMLFSLSRVVNLLESSAVLPEAIKYNMSQPMHLG